MFILNAEAYEIHQSHMFQNEGLDLETRCKGTITNTEYEKIPFAIHLSNLFDLCNGIFILFDNFILKCEPGFDGILEILDLKGRFLSAVENTPISLNAAFAMEWKDFYHQCSLSTYTSRVDAQSSRLSVKFIEDCYRIAEKHQV
jgi:hypothetical protein